MAGMEKYESSAEKFHFKLSGVDVGHRESSLLFQKIDSLHALYINKIGLDFEIHVLDSQNQRLRLPLHKIVLAAHVDKLDPNLGSEIDLTGSQTTQVNWALLQPVIEFLYTRQILISESDVQDLLSIAKVLKLKTLRECCISFLKKSSAHNVVRYLTWAKDHELTELKEPLLKSAASHLPLVLQCPEVQFLDAKDLHFLLEKEEAHSQGEIIPLRALALWLGQNDKEGKLTKEQKLELTKLINLKGISVQDLQKDLKLHIGILAIDECKKILFHDIKEKLFTTSRNWALRDTGVSGSLKEATAETFIFAVVSQRPKMKDPQILTGQTNGLLELSWLNSPKIVMPQKTNGAPPRAMVLHRSAAILEGRLYLLGGLEPRRPGLKPSEPSNSVLCYDFKQGHWLTLSPMLQKRYNFGVATYNGLLYVIGGQGKGIKTLNSCESYIPREDRWILLTALPQGKVGIGVVAHHGALVIAGGLAYVNGSKAALTTVERYDLSQHRWKRLNSLPGPGFAFGSLVEVSGTVYAVGGAAMTITQGPLESLDTILVYNDTSDIWERIAKLNCARHYAGVTALGNKIYIIGGINKNKTEFSVECFCTDTRLITTLAGALQVSIIGLNSCVAYDSTHSNN